jgi:TolB-like protein
MTIAALIVPRLVSDADSRARSEPAVRSFAVLPLVDLSEERREEYFADGLTDALITSLGQVSALTVTSRTSAMHYKGSSKRAPDIARELGVEALV